MPPVQSNKSRGIPCLGYLLLLVSVILIFPDWVPAIDNPPTNGQQLFFLYNSSGPAFGGISNPSSQTLQLRIDFYDDHLAPVTPACPPDAALACTEATSCNFELRAGANRVVDLSTCGGGRSGLAVATI